MDEWSRGLKSTSLTDPGQESMDWLNRPVSISVADCKGVLLEECQDIIPNESLRVGLAKCGYKTLFPVQHTLLSNFRNFRDYGVVAPTGSGKTLAYIIPILNDLMSRRVVRLRALIIVPTRVLALQALKTITDLVTATPHCDLQVGCATGKTALSKEQDKIFDSVEAKSRVDILICTPGRLVEHLRNTSGFSLSDLKYLVIDEADRLLEQAYQDWLQLVIEATCPKARLARPFGEPLEDINWRKHDQLMKIILSASLTKRPAQLLHLHLNNPVLIQLTMGDQVESQHFPDTLSHNFMVVPGKRKPLALAYLLKTVLCGKRILCFVNSTASAQRLARFITELGSVECSFITAETDKTQSEKILHDFESNPASMLIASDCLSRGIHISDIQAVINYDAPTDASLYIHRAGRTARAGASGACFTILAPKEANYFKQTVMTEAKRVRPDSAILKEMAPIVDSVLERIVKTRSIKA